MNPRIPPMQESDLPERKTSFQRMTGPGAVMVSIGAVTYISFAVYTVWEKAASWLGQWRGPQLGKFIDLV